MTYNPILIPDKPVKLDEEPGMTLLDHFAGHALAGLLAGDVDDCLDKQKAAELAYLFATEMLEVRRKKSKGEQSCE